MFIAAPRTHSWLTTGLRRPGGRFGIGDPWNLQVALTTEEPGLGEYGLLDPRLAEEADLPRDGLLSQPGIQTAQADFDDLPIPERKPQMPNAGLPVPPRKPARPLEPPLSTATIPFALRNRTLEKPKFLSAAHDSEWSPFHHELRRTGMETETQIDAARTIFGMEGGMAFDSIGRSVAGLEDDTLKDINKRIDKGQLPRMQRFVENSRNLSLPEAARGYKVVLDDVLNNVDGGEALARIRDRKAALQMADILFHLHHEGAEAIQRGINHVVARLPDALQHTIGAYTVEIDKIPDVGPQTFGVFNRLINAGFAEELRDAIADGQLYVLRRRWENSPKGKAAGRSFEDWAGGQIDRANYFR